MAVVSSSAALRQPEHTSTSQKADHVKVRTRMTQHGNPKFPPLAPGPPRIFAPQSSMAVSRPKKNSTACLACKTAKRKVSISIGHSHTVAALDLEVEAYRWRPCLSQCSGPPSPCKACINAGSESDCHFDPSRDLRRKVAVKRTIQELTDYKDVFFSLVTTIRTGQMDEVEEVIALIRNRNGSIEDIAHSLGHRESRFSDPRTLATASQLTVSEDGDHEPPLTEPLEVRLQQASEAEMISSPEEPLHFEPPSSAKTAFDPYARVSLESLCDIPLFRVPAKPWTDVTGDSELVSHLVSLYFTWDHPCAQFVDQGMFLQHMGQGDLHSEVCTPLLVNSLLAMASVRTFRSPLFLRRERRSNPDRCIPIAQTYIQLPRMPSLAGNAFLMRQSGSGGSRRDALLYRISRPCF